MNTALKFKPAPTAAPQETTLLGQTVDRLGYVQAQMAPLKKEESQLKAMLRASGEEAVEGDLFRATIVVPTPSSKTDWQALAEELAAKLKLPVNNFNKLIDKHTHVGEQGEARVSVKARRGE